LRDINNTQLYDPEEKFVFNSRISHTSEGFAVFYNVSWKDTATNVQVRWEVRKTLGQEEGTPVASENLTEIRSGKSMHGKVLVAASPAMQVLVAKVIDVDAKIAWFYYRVLEPNYPGQGIIRNGDQEVVQAFIHITDDVVYDGPGSTAIVSYYNDNFPAAAPAFSEAQAKVSKRMEADSTYAIEPGVAVNFSMPGLYLIQQDTLEPAALAFRAQDDYPRLQRVQSLADPLIYICTKQEFEKVKAAKGDKKAFDRVILSITGDTERARIFMRSYFRRVELANLYFTSYKEGWKTDRGMIFIIFGLPDTISKLADREIWAYENTNFKETFTFAKSGTIFDPDNFVLIRDNKYKETWYEIIDLWRAARFLGIHE
jgi:GWxTD domain-containing protein